MKSSSITGGLFEKPAAGFFLGLNSNKLPWLLLDSQYRWGVNIVNRGGIPQTRPGKAARLSLPPGDNLQGMIVFKTRKQGIASRPYCVAAVDGKVYAIPFTDDLQLLQPANNDYEPFRLPNIEFKPEAKNVYWAIGAQSLAENAGSGLSVIPTTRMLIMQDGESEAAYWDGEIGAHTPDIPIGTWMKWSGNRLAVAVDNTVVIGDLVNPLSFQERLSGLARGDFQFENEITGFANSTAEASQSNLLVFTDVDTTALATSRTDRETWVQSGFRTVVFPSVGCAAGRSISLHAGLLWWYSSGGLINSDAAAAAFLTSQLRYRDIEMAKSKRNFAPDISTIASASFENYLLMSVPNGDTLNSQTMVLDYSVADELNGEAPPAWNSVWTGTRPVEWSTITFNGQKRIFFASVDYQELDGSFNRVWEAFQPERADSHETVDADGVRVRQYTPIYCEFESKQYGDGMDLKRFRFAEADLIEMLGDVHLKISYAGTTGGYREVFDQKYKITDNRTDNEQIQAVFDKYGVFLPQGRRATTQDAEVLSKQEPCSSVETRNTPNVSRAFSFLFQWCGRMGIDAFRMFTAPEPEKSGGGCPQDESGINVLLENGRSIHLPDENNVKNPAAQNSSQKTGFLSALTPRNENVFYSSIPVEWQDLPERTVDMECARATFVPPVKNEITINGEVF